MLRGIFVPLKAALVSAAFLLLAAACATPDAMGGSRSAVERWGRQIGFVSGHIDAGGFRLFRLTRRVGRSDTLTIYIEGDGAPWATPFHPPHDPTPVKPIALALAAADPAPAIVYLGRPCQYLDDDALARCDSDYWMGRRFAPAVVAAYGQALDRLKAEHGAQSLRLIGHSGGGVIAVLLAQRRADVVALITVAAPLALADWTSHHQVTALSASLDPLAQAGSVAHGVHWTGGRDRNVPPSLVAGFVRHKGGRMMTVARFDHECCWAQQWPALLSRSIIQETQNE